MSAKKKQTVNKSAKSGEGAPQEDQTPAPGQNSGATTVQSANANLVLQNGKRWKEHVQKLLDDPTCDYRALEKDGIDFGIMKKNDLLYQLAKMPFNFRLPAFYLYEAGYQVFGKVPFKPGELDDNGKIKVNSIAAALPRPISCPEPPGPGEYFTIAWMTGKFWKYFIPPPSLGKPESWFNERNNVQFFANQSMVLNPHNDLYAEEEIREALEDLFHDSHQSVLDAAVISKRNRIIDHVLEGVEDLMYDLHNDCGPEAQNVYFAFYAGILYARKIMYPRCDELYNVEELATHGEWSSIIKYALMRHGVETSQKDLLRKIGCKNVENYSKRSKELIEFEYSFTPSINCMNFDSCYRNARKESYEIRILPEGHYYIAEKAVVADPAKMERDRANYHKRKEKHDKNDELIKKAIKKKEEMDGFNQAKEAAARKSEESKVKLRQLNAVASQLQNEGVVPR